MPRRTLLTALIVTLVLGAAALAPGTSVVRDGLLRYLIAAAERQGVSIAYSSSSGNAWSGVTLAGLRVDAFGSHLTFDRLRVGYFLPALLGGELPLDAEVEGAAGEIDLSDLDLVASGGSGPAVGFTPRVRLGQVRLVGSTVTIKQVPFTLPDATISDLTLENGAAGLLVGGELITAKGAARFSGTLDPNTLNFIGAVERADVTLAQHWWPGALGGTVTGTLAVVNGRISGDFTLVGGSVAELGMSAEEIAGTVKLHYPLLTAELRGHGMGGEVRASGTVDIEAERFAVTGEATPSLAAAVAWLLRDQFPAEFPFAVEGNTTIDLAISGWRTVDFTGTARGDGTVNGLAAAGIDARFGLKGNALDVDSTMTLAGGHVSLAVAPGPRGEQLLRVRASDVDLSGFEYAGLRPGGTLRSVSVDLPMGGNPQGRLAATWAGDVAGAAVDLALDGRLDPDGWQAFVSGSGDPGIELSGAVVLADGRLDGGVNLRNVRTDLLGTPVDLAVSATGTPTDLALRAEVNGREPLTLALAGFELAAATDGAPIDLRGSLTARLTNGAVGPVDGRFGPVTLTATVGTAPLRVEADFTLDPVVVASGSATGAGSDADAASQIGATLAVTTGHATFADGVITVNAAATATDAHVGPLALELGSLPVDLRAGGDGWTLAIGAAGEPVALRVGSDDPSSLTVTDLPARLAGGERWASISAALNEADGGYAFTVSVPRAAEAVGVALPLDLALQGRLEQALGSATATGLLGDLPVRLEADWTGARSVAVSAAGLNLDYSLADGAWSATGTAEVEALARALGFGAAGAEGSMALDLHGVAGGTPPGAAAAALSGLVDVTLVKPLPLRLSGVATGDGLALTLVGEAAGLPVSGEGALSLTPHSGGGPGGAMTLAVGPLTGIVVDLTGVRGGGTLAELALGPVSVLPLEWDLDFSWSELAGGLSLGGERLDVRSAGGRWRLSGALAATAAYAGTEYRATLTPGPVGATVATLTDPATVPLSLSLVNTATGAHLADASGTPAELTLTVDAAAAELAAMLPEQYRPDWRVTAEATIDLLRGPRYRASLDLVPAVAREGEEPLRARLSGTGARADLVLEGAGIYVSNEVVRGAGRLRLRADDAALDRYLPAGMTGTLGGTLVLEQGRWLGALTAQLAGPLTATVRLTGQGEELRVAADASAAGDLNANAAGTLVPQLALTGTASAKEGLATATFAWRDGLSGELLTSPLELGDVASVPAMAFDFALEQATGSVTLRARESASPAGAGDEASPGQPAAEGALTLAQGTLGGRLVVSARTAAGLVAVALTPSGTLGDARVQADVSGAVTGDAEASLSAGVSAKLLVPAASLGAAFGLDLVASALPEPAKLSIALAPDGAWRAEAAAQIAVAGLPDGLTPGVRADLAGHGLTYAGQVSVANGGAEVATASLAGEAANLRAELDLGTVDWRALGAAFGLDLDVTGGGRAGLTTRPFTTELVLDLSARLGDNVLRLAGTAPDDLSVSLRGPAGELDGLLAWESAPGALPAAHLAGTFGGAPLELRVAGDGAGGGTLAATYSGASLSARIGAGTGAVELAAPAGSLAPVGFTATSALAWGGQGVTLTALDATVSGLLPADDLRLSLSGTLSAADSGLEGLNLTGTLAAGSDLEPATLAVGPHELRLGWGRLAATLGASPADSPAALLDLARARLALTGSATEADVAELLSLFPAAESLAPLRVEIESADLTWARATGFAGDLAASAVHTDLPEARAELSATGAGGLFAHVKLLHERVTGPAAEARVELSADPLADASLGGTLTAHAPLAAVAPQVGGFLAELSADLQLGGTLASPTLAGTARVTGDVAASGPVTFADGRLTVKLDGPALRASSTVTLAAPQSWRAEVALTDLDVGGWLAQVDEPRLSLSASLEGSGVMVSDLRLAAPRSLVTGSGSLGYDAGGLRLNLSAAVDLADVDLNGTELTGTLRGPVAIAATSLGDLGGATITAALDATAVGARGLGGSVSGTLSLGGSLADPVVNADLRGDGRVRGTLTASARPAAGEVQLASDLTFGQFATDLRASLHGGEARASGSARWGEAVLLLSDVEEGGEGTVRMTGAGRLTGWTASVASDLSWARLAGDLATVQPDLAGALQLRLAGDGAGPWLQGTVLGTAVAGIALGDLDIVAEAPFGTVSLTSEHLRGEFEVGAGRWTAELADLAMAADTRLSASGSGTLQDGALTARLSGAQLELEAHLSSTGGAIEANLSGQAFGGALELSAARAADARPWTGTAGYAGGSIGGFAIDATGTVQGEGQLPQLVLLTNAAGALTASGRVTVSTAGLTLDQFVEGGPLTQSVRVQGRVYPDTDLTVATLLEAPRPGATAALPTSSQVRLRTVLGAGLTAAGTVRLELGPARVTLGGDNSAPVLAAQVAGLPGLRAQTELHANDLFQLVTNVAAHGLELTGTDDVSGSLRVDLAPEPSVTFRGLSATVAGVGVSADGTVTAASADVRAEVVFRTDLQLTAAQAEPGEYRLPVAITAGEGTWRLEYDGPLGLLHGTYDQAGGVVGLDADLRIGGGRVNSRLEHSGGELRGNVQVEGVRLAPAGVGAVVLTVDSTVADGRIGGSVVLEAEAGRLTLTGSWGLAGILPESVVAGAPKGGRLEARLRTLELSKLPVVAARAPYLTGALTGVVQLRDEFVFGQLVSPEISAAGSTSRLELDLSGSLSSLDASLRLKGATVAANLAGNRLSGLGRFERFPAQFLAQAVVGPSDVTADTTGVVRFDLPFADLGGSYLRLATEEVRLERAGVPTVGNLTIVFDAGKLVVERADFAGLGSWDAHGELSLDRFDFHLSAADADFTPLLGIVPSLARIGAGATGTFTLDVSGDAAVPQARFASPGLDIELSGSRYRLADTEIELDGAELSVAALVSGVSPLEGALSVVGDARLTLAPLALTDVDVGFDGSLDLLSFGVVQDLHGALTKGAAGELRLDATGLMGTGTLELTGSVLPLALSARGNGLTVAFPALLVGRALVDADLTVAGESGGVALGGAVVASEIIVDPSARGSTTAAEGGEPPTQARPAGGGEPASVLRFADLAIRAPQRVLLSTNLGSGEAALDLVLSGNAADPKLTGTAHALRGNLRFSGRDFTIDRAVATFNQSGGVYPELDVAAHAEFDKSRVVSADSRVSFAAPREGQTFVVELAFTGQMVPAPGEEGGFRFDLQPRVSSDARIDVEGEGVRSFTDAELMSLITLGRFELNSGIVASGGLGQAVAQGALDTAIDLFVISELSNALKAALGLDVVEIKTSAISSLIDDSTHPFGVSLRLGGYLNPELFASYRIGTYDGADGGYSLTNEVMLSYGLGPLDLDVTARVDVPTAGMNESPRPEIGVALSYSFGPTFGVDTGVVLSTQRSAFQVGLTLRW